VRESTHPDAIALVEAVDEVSAFGHRRAKTFDKSFKALEGQGGGLQEAAKQRTGARLTPCGIVKLTSPSIQSLLPVAYSPL
jgi:hypothetical protein